MHHNIINTAFLMSHRLVFAMRTKTKRILVYDTGTQVYNENLIYN